MPNKIVKNKKQYMLGKQGSLNSQAGDEVALEAIYSSLDGANWNTSKTYTDHSDGTTSTATGDNTGWSSSGMSLSDNIFGVVTATIDGELRVTEINLERNGLEGTLPEEVGNLKQCKVFRVKKNKLSGDLPDGIGKLSNCWYLSLAGRTLDDEYTEGLGAYNKKHGTATNHFTGDIPTSWYSGLTSLKMFELDGLYGQFNGTLGTDVSNWTNIERVYIGGNLWHDNTNPSHPQTKGSSFTGQIPSEISAWVNCEDLQGQDQNWSGIGTNAFIGWNDITRHIELGYDGNPDDVIDWNQPHPDVSHLTQIESISFGARTLNGEFPEYLFGFTNLNALSLDKHNFTKSDGQFPSLSSFGNNAFRFNISDALVNGESADLFSIGENVAGYFDNQMILYSATGKEYTGEIPEGMDSWAMLRVFSMGFANYSGTLPEDPAGEYSPSLIRIRMNDNNLTGGIPVAYGNVGTNQNYGGAIETGTISNFGEDATGYWIEDDSKNWTTDEFVTPANYAGPLIRYPTDSFQNRRTISSNTSIRIYYDDHPNHADQFRNLSIGNSFEIVRNGNDDVRDFIQFDVSNNKLDQTIQSESVPNLQATGEFNISNNNLLPKHLSGDFNAINTKATNNNWDFIYSPQNNFGEAETVNAAAGTTVTLDQFSTLVTDAGNSYQWKKDGTNLSDGGDISGATTDTLTIANGEIADNGNYTLEVTNSTVTGITWTSEAITLSIS